MTSCNNLAVRCAGLTKKFDGVAAVDGCDLTLQLGNVVGIIGPNGAGKTTLFNLLTGFLAADSGSCQVLGADIKGLAPQAIARLGVARTFQEVRLIRQVSVLENATLASLSGRTESLVAAFFPGRWRRADGEAKHRATLALESVGLDSEAQRLAGELSYGQQKLLSLACCLATGAQLLLLDEPIAGVDLKHAREILERLRNLKSAERLVVFIEHDLAAVREAADEVVVMDEGRVLATGAPEALLQRADVIDAYFA